MPRVFMRCFELPRIVQLHAELKSHCHLKCLQILCPFTLFYIKKKGFQWWTFFFLYHFAWIFSQDLGRSTFYLSVPELGSLCFIGVGLCVHVCTDRLTARHVCILMKWTVGHLVSVNQLGFMWWFSKLIFGAFMCFVRFVSPPGNVLCRMLSRVLSGAG